MADNQLAQVTAGKTGFVSQINQYFSALTVNFLPRSVAGTVADLAGTVGETTRRWSNGFFKVFTIKGDSKEIVINEDGFSYGDILTFLNGTNENAKAGSDYFTTKTRGYLSQSGGDARRGEFVSTSFTLLNGTSHHLKFETWLNALILVTVKQAATDVTYSTTNMTEIFRINGQGGIGEQLILYRATSDDSKYFSMHNSSGGDVPLVVTMWELH